MRDTQPLGKRQRIERLADVGQREDSHGRVLDTGPTAAGPANMV